MCDCQDNSARHAFQIAYLPRVSNAEHIDFVVVRDGRDHVPVRVVLQPARMRAPLRRGYDIKWSTETTEPSHGLR